MDFKNNQRVIIRIVSFTPITQWALLSSSSKSFKLTFDKNDLYSFILVQVLTISPKQTDNKTEFRQLLGDLKSLVHSNGINPKYESILRSAEKFRVFICISHMLSLPVIARKIQFIQHFLHNQIVTAFERCRQNTDLSGLRKYYAAAVSIGAQESCIAAFMEHIPLFVDTSIMPSVYLPLMANNDKSAFYQQLNGILVSTFDVAHTQLDTIRNVLSDHAEIAVAIVEKFFRYSHINVLIDELEKRKDDIRLDACLITWIHLQVACVELLAKLEEITGKPVDHQKYLGRFSVFMQKFVENETGGLNQQCIKHSNKLNCVHKSVIISSEVFEAKRKEFVPMLKSELEKVNNRIEESINKSPHQSKASAILVLHHSTRLQEKYTDYSYLVDLVMDFIAFNQEAVLRTGLLFYDDDEQRHQAIHAIFKILIDSITRITDKAFQLELTTFDCFMPKDDRLPSISDFKNQFMRYINMVNWTDLIPEFLSIYLSMQMSQWINKTDITIFQGQGFLKSYERFLDEKVATGMEKTIEVLIEHVEYVLSHTQHPSDYCQEIIAGDVRMTKACKAAITTLNEYLTIFHQILDKHTLELFSAEIGSRLFSTLCKHIKSCQITESGGFILICDLNVYNSWICDNLNASAEVRKMFASLKELCNIFIVPPKDLNNMLKDEGRFLGYLKVEDVEGFLQARSDRRKGK